jgi:hypothetical protein
MKGQKTGGRQAGTPNKITSAVREAFERAFTALQESDDGSANLETWARANPTEFYKLAAKLIPTDINANVRGTLMVVTGVPTDDDYADLV